MNQFTSDAFINRVDKLTRPEDVHKLQTEMIIYFSNLMASQAKSKPHSKQIVLCIDYINQNLHNNIDILHIPNNLNNHVLRTHSFFISSSILTMPFVSIS